MHPKNFFCFHISLFLFMLKFFVIVVSVHYEGGRKKIEGGGTYCITSSLVNSQVLNGTQLFVWKPHCIQT